MRITSWSLVVLLCGMLLLSGACKGKPPGDDEVAVLETSYGRIVIELLGSVAPKQVENFTELAREGFYDGTRIHAIVKDKGQVAAIQGGDPTTINGDPSSWGQGQKGQKTVPAEFSSLKHERGTVSAARAPKDINSATSQFFICVIPRPAIDGQYSIFGRVIDGMNVVDSIARAPTYTKTTVPVDAVVVNRVYIAKRTEVQ